jgi:hypothetical protein
MQRKQQQDLIVFEVFFLGGLVNFVVGLAYQGKEGYCI